MERNRKDLLIRFDATVSHPCLLYPFEARTTTKGERWTELIPFLPLPPFLLLQTNLPNFRTQLYKNIQRSYVEFRLFADQLSVGNPQSEPRLGSSELNGENKSSLDPPFLPSYNSHRLRSPTSPEFSHHR